MLIYTYLRRNHPTDFLLRNCLKYEFTYAHIEYEMIMT